MKRSVFVIPEDVHTLELLRICKKLYAVGYRWSDVMDLCGVIIRFEHTDFNEEIFEAIVNIMSDLDPVGMPF